MKYRIIKSSFFDSKGKETNVNYHIEIQKSLLGISYWKPVRHKECYAGDCDYVRTPFNKYKDAVEFAENVLCQNKNRDKHIETIVSEHTC